MTYLLRKIRLDEVYRNDMVYIQYEHAFQFKTMNHVTRIEFPDWSQVQNMEEHDRSYT